MTAVLALLPDLGGVASLLPILLGGGGAATALLGLLPNLRTYALIGLGVLLALSVIGLLWYRGQYEGEVAARAGDLVAAQAAVEKAQTQDAAHTREIEDAHAAEVASLKEQANAREISIAAVASTDTCASSPAMRALFGGLRARAGTADTGQPGGAGRAGAPVSGRTAAP